MTDLSCFDRRCALYLLGASAAAFLVSRVSCASRIGTLALYGPPGGPSVILCHAVASGGFSAIADRATFTAWRNPDELRAGLTSGSIQLSVVPIQAAANLYNRGFPIRLANVMTNGLLYIIGEDREIRTIPDLSGRSIAAYFRGDTPDIILRRLLAHHGLDPDKDVKIVYAGGSTEAMQLLLSGRVEAALGGGPSASAAILRAREAGRTMRRVIDIQSAWGEMTDAPPVLPQAGLALTVKFLDENGDALPDLLKAIEVATAEVLSAPGIAAEQAAKALALPASLLKASIPHCHLVARPAHEARTDIERMLAAMAGPKMARIGGRLPEAGFYL